MPGARGNSFFQQAAARGLQSAGEHGGGANTAFMNSAENMMGATQQGAGQNSYQPNFGTAQNENPAQMSPEDPTEKLIRMKKLLDTGIITQEEFDKAKKDLLGIYRKVIKRRLIRPLNFNIDMTLPKWQGYIFMKNHHFG